MVYRVLSTKKLQPNQKLYLLNAGLAVVEADFIGIEYKPFEITDIANNLIFTSANGFRGFLKHADSKLFTGNIVFCVGDKTKELIERHGFTVTAVANDAEALAEIIIRDYNNRMFTFFSGSMRRETLPDALAKANIPLTETQVYDTVLAPQKINTPVDAILFFSPSAVQGYLVENTITDEACFCIGATTAAALEGITDKIVIAHKPSVENVIVQVRSYFAKFHEEGTKEHKE
ncbi:uroporphyrinogen-III synthase [Flavobacterium sp. RHBU_24]|uniref:uroporphyrinogen-III synthase n=1 Tax=Flavobacterium sp. RHBU_24 TaxID=3391185 RepID=UPI0039851348